MVLLGQKHLKLGQKRAQNQPEDPNLTIKLERKVLETPFWYQTKALHEHSLNKLFWQQINMHKVSTSPKSTIFGSKTAISRPLINLKITTFNIKPTPKIFLALYTTPTNTKSSYKKPGSLLKMWYSVTQCPTYGPIIAAIAELTLCIMNILYS